MSAPGSSPRVAVVTVAYNSEAVLDAFLESVPAAISEPWMTVVVDNAPSERIAASAARQGASYVPLPHNPGYGGAINRAVSALPAGIQWVLISNPDVVLGESSIDVLVAGGETDERIGAIGPAVRDATGTIYPSARRIPSLRTGVGHALFAGIWPTNPWSRAYREESSPYRREAGWLSGSCLLVRRAAFDEVGGFDTRYFMYFEDVDLGYRLGHRRWKNVYEPGASVVHTGAHSTTADSAAMLRAHHRSASQFIDAKYHGPFLAPVRLVTRLGLRLREWMLLRGMN